MTPNLDKAALTEREVNLVKAVAEPLNAEIARLQAECERLKKRIADLEGASRRLIRNLDRRIEEADGAKVPVFDGIAELHSLVGEEDDPE